MSFGIFAYAIAYAATRSYAVVEAGIAVVLAVLVLVHFFLIRLYPLPKVLDNLFRLSPITWQVWQFWSLASISIATASLRLWLCS